MEPDGEPGGSRAEEEAMSGVFFESQAETLGPYGRTGTGMDHVSGGDDGAWAGWAVFAGVLMLAVGGFQAIAGLVSLLNEDAYQVRHDELAIAVDYTVWGWSHLVVGALVVCAGVAVLRGHVWGRAVGVVMATVSAFAHVLFLHASPIWALIVIAMDVCIIYALCVHGGELRRVPERSS